MTANAATNAALLDRGTSRTRRVRGSSDSRGERGVVGGAEALAFGTLVLLAGTILCTQLWAIVETRVALDAAAREYLRAYTAARDDRSAQQSARDTALVVLAARETPLSDVEIVAPDPARFGPCGEATVEMSATVPALRLPFIGTVGTSTVTIHHRDLIDAHREVTAHADFEPQATACG